MIKLYSKHLFGRKEKRNQSIKDLKHSRGSASTVGELQRYHINMLYGISFPSHSDLNNIHF